MINHSPELPLVSVLIPVYNAGLFLRETLDDILNQTFTDFEVILIDDGSTDDSFNIMKSYSDNRIRLFQNEKNSGQVFTLNYGLSLCTGKYIARIDADDRCHPTRLEKQVHALESNQTAGLCLSWYRILGSQKTAKPSTNPAELKVKLFFRNQIGNSTVMLRRDVIESHHIRFTTEIPVAEDYYFWTRVLAVSDPVIIPEVLMEYREHPGQTSELKKELIKTCTDKVRLFQLNFLGITPDESQAKLHLKLISNPNFSGEEISHLLKWTDYLRLQNVKTGFFNPELFDSELRKRELLSWKRFQPDVKSNWQTYKDWKSEHPSIGLKNEIKLFLRCLFV